MRTAAYIIIVMVVAAVLAASVRSCVARKKEFARYPTVEGLQGIHGDIRVLLADGVSCKVSVSGRYKIIADGRAAFDGLRPMPDVLVRPLAAGGIAIGDLNVKQERAEVVPAAGDTLRVNGSAYRGKLMLARRKDRRGAPRLLAVNVLPLEEYLAGVISSEMHSFWPMAALRAQAIAARSYALCRARSRSRWNYDVAATTADQVYKGIAGETASARRAAGQTRGVILLYDWQILPAYYHSVCGGRTASRKAVFGETDITPLAGVDCKYCNPKLHGGKNSGFYHWQVVVPHAKVVRALAAKGHSAAGIKAIEPVDPDRGHHAREMTLTPLSGPPFKLSIAELRRVIGPGKLKSNCFECRKKGNTLVFRGKGFGHGVGMCQWGAKGMAISGYDTKAILEYYYPGTEIRRVY